MCGPHRRFAPLLPRTLRRIPQAVGAVATPDASFEHYTDLKQVSIPQAVGAVATAGSRKPVFMRFKKLVLENLKP